MRNRTTVALLLATSLGCGTPAERPATADGPIDHVDLHLDACVEPLPERPYSDQDEKIFEVVSYSPDDREGALDEMAQKFGISSKAAREAFVRVLQAKQAGWPNAVDDAVAAIFGCLADAHGMQVMEFDTAAGHVTIFVEAQQLAAEELDRFAEEMLRLEYVSSVTAQLHVDGIAKIRRDYPIGAAPAR